MTSAQITDEDCEKLLALATQPLFRGFQGSAELDALGLGQDEQARAFRKSSIERYLTEKLFIEPQISDRISDIILIIENIDNKKIKQIISINLINEENSNPRTNIDPKTVVAIGKLRASMRLNPLNDVPIFPGKRAGVKPLDWYDEHYKKLVYEKSICWADVARHDRSFSIALGRELGKESGIFPTKTEINEFRANLLQEILGLDRNQLAALMSQQANALRR